VAFQNISINNSFLQIHQVELKLERRATTCQTRFLINGVTCVTTTTCSFTGCAIFLNTVVLMSHDENLQF